MKRSISLQITKSKHLHFLGKLYIVKMICLRRDWDYKVPVVQSGRELLWTINVTLT